MKCQEFDLNHALGVKIFEEIRLDGMVLEKGHTLNEEDIIRLKISGVPSVYGALMDENDLTLEAALGIVAAKLCGKNTAYAVGHDGICKITASVDGVFLCADDRVAKFNRQSHNLILNTVPPYVYVAAKLLLFWNLRRRWPSRLRWTIFCSACPETSICCRCPNKNCAKPL